MGSLGKKASSPFRALQLWFNKQPPRVKAVVGFVSGILTLLLLWLFAHDRNHLFVAAESVHAVGILVLIYKLQKEKNCAGLSLKSQELTALFLAARLFCSFMLEQDIHTILDTATLITTLWVIYMIRFKLKASYMRELDSLPRYYVIVPCAVLACAVHPTIQFHIAYRVLWSFCVYLEAVSVLPQLRIMQNTKLVEPFTAHYVFALGVARFLNCAHWIIQIIDTRGFILVAMGRGVWMMLVFLSEIVQTFILADFCYYYVKSIVSGQLMVRLPAGIV